MSRASPLLLALSMMSVTPAIADEFSIVRTGDMVAATSEHRAVRLENGSVLITGGEAGDGGMATAQIYNPASGTFTEIAPLKERRFVHAMARLPDGRVLVAGGFNNEGRFLGTTEIFDGERFVEGPSLVENRDNERSVVLSDGSVFLEGGDNERAGYVDSSEIFDPITNSVRSGPSFHVGRAMDAISKLQSGTVIMSGGLKIVGEEGVPLKGIYEYKPAEETITKVGRLETGRKQHRATVLDDDTILITGGSGANGELASAELFDPATQTTIQLPDMSSPRREHCSVRLADGRVLIAGGYDGSGYSATTEIFDPKNRTFSSGPTMTDGRAYQTCTRLADGSILIAGGTTTGSKATSSAELPHTPK